MKRVEGLSKLTGHEQYVDDLPLDGCLWEATVRSPTPRGRIREVRFGNGIDWSEYAVVEGVYETGAQEHLYLGPGEPAEKETS